MLVAAVASLVAPLLHLPRRLQVRKTPSPSPSLTRVLLGAPPPAQKGQGGGLFSGLAGTLMQGAALGTGSAFAHRAVDSVMGSRGESAAPQQTPLESSQDPCQRQAKAFADCISDNNGDMGACQYYFDSLQQCKIQLNNV